MKKPANIVILSLMVSSIVLLLVLEGFWLKSSYVNEFNQLKREVNFAFRSTLFAIQDSVIQKSIKPLTGDSGADRIYNTARKFHDTLKFISKDSRVARNIPVSRDNVQIFINAPGNADSIKSLMIRPLISRFKSDTTQKTFTISFRGDTLNQSDIRRKFKSALAGSDIDLPFEINTVATGLHPKPAPQMIITDWVPTFGENMYMASFDDVNLAIIKKITPQILFSFTLSCLTAISFIFMYRSIRSQQRLVAIKNDLISNITHELKTPIATVSVALEALKDFKGIENPQLTSEYLDIAQYELGRLSLLTDKVLTASLFDENGIKLHEEMVDLEKVVNDILRSMKLVFEKHQAQVTFEKEGDSFTLSGSSVHLTNMAYNLVDNALKYSPSQPYLNISLHDLGEKITISFADKGIGIPEEFQSRVFEKFFRVPTGDVHTVKGHGLGLNYVKKVVGGHQGEIHLVSKPGEGCKFTITLPKKID